MEIIDFADPKLLEEFNKRRKDTPLIVASSMPRVFTSPERKYNVSVYLLRPYSALEVYPVTDRPDPSEFQWPQGIQRVLEANKRLQVARANYPELNKGLSGYLFEYEEDESGNSNIKYYVSALATHPLIIGSMLDGGVDQEKVDQIDWKGLDFPIDGRINKISLRSHHVLATYCSPYSFHSTYSSRALHLEEDVDLAIRIRSKLKKIAKVIDMVALPFVEQILALQLRQLTYTHEFIFYFSGLQGAFHRGSNGLVLP